MTPANSHGVSSPPPDDFQQCVEAYLAGTATDEQIEWLSSRLRTDDAARDRFLEQADLHACLHADELLWNDRTHEVYRPQANAMATASDPGRFSRTAIAVSLIVGILAGAVGTGVAWALASPNSVVSVKALSLLVDGGFEKKVGRLATGFPSVFGEWSGDEAEIISAANVNGSRALRFVRAAGDAAVPNSPARSCDVFQLVDLRSLRSDVTNRETTLEMSARFLDARAASNVPVTFTCRLYVFSGSPESLQSDWPLTRTEAIAMGSGQLESRGGSPANWQTVTAKLLLPAVADFAVVQLVVGKPPSGDGEVAEFGEHFADDVQLTLRRSR